MDKPNSMSVKDYLIKVQSVRTNTPLKTIEAIIEHQFEAANKALDENDSIEISGFGKFLFNSSKAKRKWEKNLSKKEVFQNKLKEELTEQKRKSFETKLQSTIDWLERLKPKMIKNGLIENSGGLAQQSNTTKANEESNRADVSGENENMQRM